VSPISPQDLVLVAVLILIAVALGILAARVFMAASAMHTQQDDRGR
jgi:hypothetical protein